MQKNEETEQSKGECKDGIYTNGYGMNPKLLWEDPKLTQGEKILYAYFLSYVNPGKNFCFPSPATGMDHLKMGRDRYFKCLKGLEHRGLIVRSKMNKNPMDHKKKYILKHGESVQRGYYEFLEGEIEKIREAKKADSTFNTTPGVLETVLSQYLDKYLYNSKSKRLNSKSKNSTKGSSEKQEEPSSFPSSNFHRKKEKDTVKKSSIPEKIIEDIQKLIDLGGFPKHKLPVPGQPPSGVVTNIYKALLSIRSGRFCRDYKMDVSWIEKRGMDKSKLEKPESWEELMKIVGLAVRRFHRMKTNTSFWPASKDNLKKVGLGTFFYNIKNHNSWFLFCISNKPQKLKTAIDTKNTEPLRSKFTEEEQQEANKIMQSGWNTYGFWERTNELKEWYDENIPVLRRVNSIQGERVRGTVNGCISSFRLFLKRYGEFADTWKTFYLSNFGLRNGTWKYFISFMLKEHGVVLDPTPMELRFTESVLSRN